MLHFRTGRKYPGAEIVVVISDEEFWVAAAADELLVRYPGILWNSSTIVADEAAKDAWIAAMNTYTEAYEDYGGMRGEWKISFEEREAYELIMANAMRTMGTLEIQDPTLL